jgi:hypothetical protein
MYGGSRIKKPGVAGISAGLLVIFADEGICVRLFQGRATPTPPKVPFG